MGFLKKIFFWSYGRTTWQYDVLCVLILAFIFLTPQYWFNSSELRSKETHPKPVAATYVLVNPEVAAQNLHREEIERRVREATGRPEIVVTGVRPRLDARGQIVAYEVDIK